MFKKRITCFHCKGEKTFSSGPGAVVAATWNCPTCHGKGVFILNLRKQLWVWILTQLDSVRQYTY